MICKRCYRMSDDDMKYCPYCGKSFTDDSEIEIKKSDENKVPEDKESSYEGGYDAPRIDFERIGTPPQPREKTPLGKFISAVWHAFLYLMLFLVMQTIAASFFMSAAMVSATGDYMEQYYSDNNIDIGSMSEEEYSALVRELSSEIEAIMLDSMNDIDMNKVTIVSSVLTILVLLITAKIKKRRFYEHVGLYPVKSSRTAVIIPSAVALQFLVIILLCIIPIPENIVESFNELYAFIGESPLWLEVIALVIFAPVTEELIFRGCIYTRLSRGMKPIHAAFISAAVFGAVHGNIIAFSYAFVLGLILAYLYEKYQSILVTILFHMCFNAANYIPLLREDSSEYEIMITAAVSVVVIIAGAVLIITDKNKSKEEQ